MLISQNIDFVYFFLPLIYLIGFFVPYIQKCDVHTNTTNSAKPDVLTVFALLVSLVVPICIAVLPLSNLRNVEILVISSLLISILLPTISKNWKKIEFSFSKSQGNVFRALRYSIVVLVYGLLQPIVLMTISENIIFQMFGTTNHFLLVVIITMAGITTLIGGKRFFINSNVFFSFVLVASLLELMFLNQSFLIPVEFLRTLFANSVHQFASQNFMETNWFMGFVGFSIITWWMWWINNSANHYNKSRGDQQLSNTTIFAACSFIVIALIILFYTTSVELTHSSTTENTIQSFFYVVAIASIMSVSFSFSFRVVKSISEEYNSNKNIPVEEREKNILISRLAIVSSILLTIVCIPFSQFLTSLFLMMYIKFLLVIASSFVGAFLLFAIRKNITQQNIVIGIVSGLIFGFASVFYSLFSENELNNYFIHSYLIALIVLLVSIFSSIAGVLLFSQKAVKESATV